MSLLSGLDKCHHSQIDSCISLMNDSIWRTFVFCTLFPNVKFEENLAGRVEELEQVVWIKQMRNQVTPIFSTRFQEQ